MKDARYIPPNVEDMQSALADLERYMNEGDDYACLSLDEFVEKNGIGSALSIVLSEEEIREALETNTVRIRLPEVEILKVS